MTSTPSIEVRQLCRSYGPLQALRAVSFTVATGQVVGFLGPNGAGKSTTLRILAGALAATSGQAFVGGVDVAADPLRVKRLLGYLPERPPVHDDMRVRACVRYAAILKGVADPDAATARALARTDLDDVAERLVGHLSKGYRQRVGLAQALVHDPRVLLLDEPTSGLDPAQRTQVRALVRELARGDVTVLLSTHVLGEVEALCDGVVVLHRGQVTAQGPLDALATAAPLRVRVARPAGLAAAVGALPGVARVDVGEPDGTFWVHGDAVPTADVARVAAAHDLLDLTRPGGLEATYLAATGGAA
ncbi:MAG: ABC transporter ATP-binding protein [Alphaproteobacteria bacterium]|nr:ABC transporter ATP-binding protein [Alphaproteobacteria bacterium]